MFGYVRPSDRRLSEQEREAFRAAYCGLCHALGKRYGLAGRMILNYDLTFLAMVLSDGAGRTGCRRCAIHPVKGCPCAEGDPALDTAADMSVILTYWQLRDGVAHQAARIRGSSKKPGAFILPRATASASQTS